MGVYLAGSNRGVDWVVQTKRTPNGMHHAEVRVGKRTEISQDHLTEEEAKDDGCSMMADMLEEVGELLNA